MIIKPSAKLAFHDTELDVFHVNQARWLSLSQIVTPLGMTRTGLQNLYKRHRSEFTREMTDIITVPTPSGAQQTRVFSVAGVIRLCMLARSERAAAFRDWAQTVLEREMGVAPPALTTAPMSQDGSVAPALPAELRTGLARLWRAQPQAGKLLRYWQRGFTNVEAAKLLDLGVSTVRRRRREAEALGLVAPPAQLAVHQARALRLVGGTHHG